MHCYRWPGLTWLGRRITSFVVAHEFTQGDNPNPVATGNEVRVWGYSDADHPAKLVARAMPEEVRAMLSVEKTVDVTV